MQNGSVVREITTAPATVRFKSSAAPPHRTIPLARGFYSIHLRIASSSTRHRFETKAQSIRMNRQIGICAPAIALHFHHNCSFLHFLCPSFTWLTSRSNWSPPNLYESRIETKIKPIASAAAESLYAS